MALGVLVPTKSDLAASADETGLRTPIIHQIKLFASNAPRSLQRSIGPSQVGTPCARQLAFQMSDRPPTRDLHDPWPSIVGTAVHAWLADCFEAANPPWPTAPIWHTERRVDVGLGLGGSCDVFHAPTGTVLDWKVLGDSQYTKYVSEGPSPTYRTQAHCYGLGYLNAGYQVNRVGICFLGRAKKLSALHIWSEPFDPMIAVKALARMQVVQKLSEAGVEPMRIPETPGGHCFFCLAAETEVVTRQGVRPISELAGGKHELLVPTAEGFGTFESVPVRSFGAQRLHKVELRRHNATKIVHATAEHRWILENGTEMLTVELRPGHRLTGIRVAPDAVAQDRKAVARGFVYGDGTKTHGTRKVGTLSVYGRSRKAGMLDYFPELVAHEYPAANGDTMQWLYGIDRAWKSRPSIELPASELISWLAGYFAADGSVSKAGQCGISSADRTAIKFVRDVAAVTGIRYGIISTSSRVGYGTEPTNLYKIDLNVRDLPGWFFLLPHHAERVVGRLADTSKPGRGWVVKSVTETDRVEEVFCATVEGAGVFGLVDDLLTGNCAFKSATPDGSDGYCTASGKKKG